MTRRTVHQDVADTTAGLKAKLLKAAPVHALVGFPGAHLLRERGPWGTPVPKRLTTATAPQGPQPASSSAFHLEWRLEAGAASRPLDITEAPGLHQDLIDALARMVVGASRRRKSR